MQYYSTNKKTPDVSLQEAVVKGLAADKGLFIPWEIKQLPATFSPISRISHFRRLHTL